MQSSTEPWTPLLRGVKKQQTKKKMADVEVSGAIREEIDCGYLETAKEETEGVTCEVDAMEQTSIEAGAVLSHEVEVIDFSEVRLKEIVGSGTFAAVYSAEYRERQIAVKVFNAKASAESLSREIAVVASLRHPNIVGFIGVAWDTANPERPVLAMEFCSMGSLFQALYPNIIDAKTRRGATAGAGHLIDPHRKRIALGTARGMAHLHRVGWAHFDICSPNVLLSEDFDPKLADFGQTRRGFGIGFPAVGHEAYRAPELCFTPSRNYQRSAHWTEKADVYSFAILLWELLHKELPWSG